MNLELNKIYKGLALETIKTFPDKSINCVITSPPYWQLRDYGFTEQWGLEPTFEEYLEHLWSLMDEIWRVLKDDGTVWVNLGDTYSSSGESGGNPDKFPERLSIKKPSSNIKSKTLLLIPHRFAIGCIDRGWIMRNDIIWAKRNGMPESVTDRFSKKHEYFFFIAKSQKYYFDLDGIKDSHKSSIKEISRQKRTDTEQGYNQANGTKQGHSGGLGYNKNGKNPGSVSDFWDIPTKPSSKEHYAAYNDELILKPILAGCHEGGIILDPFAGTGTTLCTAHIKGRNVVGIEGSEDYQKIAQSELDLIIQRGKDIKEHGFSKTEINNDYPTLF